MTERLHVQVTESSQAGEARRVASQLARRLLFSEVDVGRVSIAVTEAATNLHKHAATARASYASSERAGVPAMGMLALDRGTGIADVGRRSAGRRLVHPYQRDGLGAIERQSDGLRPLLHAGTRDGAVRRLLAGEEASRGRHPARRGLGAASGRGR
jgi:anti-sigma regulatory factor (Ser/Thr protein kinase)